MVNQKTTIITVGSTKNVYVGDTLSIYGKLSARGIGLPYKNITITTQNRITLQLPVSMEIIIIRLQEH